LIPAHPARTRWGPSSTGVARHPWPLGLPVFFPLGICRWPRLPPTLQIGVINGCKHAQRCTGPTAAERWSLPQTPRRATQRGRPSVPPVPLSLFVSALYLASAPELNSNLRLSNFYLHSVCLVSFVSLHVRRTDGRKRSVGVPSAARTIRSLVVVLTFGPIRAYTYIYYASIYQIRIPIGCNIPLPPPLPAHHGAQYSTAIGTQVKRVQMLSTPRIRSVFRLEPPTTRQIKSKASRSVCWAGAGLPPPCLLSVKRIVLGFWNESGCGDGRVTQTGFPNHWNGHINGFLASTLFLVLVLVTCALHVVGSIDGSSGAPSRERHRQRRVVLGAPLRLAPFTGSFLSSNPRLSRVFHMPHPLPAPLPLPVLFDFPAGIVSVGCCY
jgi:hypothetical protein